MDDTQMRECFVKAFDYLKQMDQVIETWIEQNQVMLEAIRQQKQNQFSELSESIHQDAQALHSLLFAMYEKACINEISEAGHGEWRDIAACLRIDAESPVGSLLSAAFLIHDIAIQSVSETTQDAINTMQDVCEIVYEYLVRLRQLLNQYRQKIEVLLE